MFKKLFKLKFYKFFILKYDYNPRIRLGIVDNFWRCPLSRKIFKFELPINPKFQTLFHYRNSVKYFPANTKF